MTELLTHLTKIGIAVVLGIFLGWEREGNRKTAGFRDIALVYLGATLIGIMSLELATLQELNIVNIRFDIGRLFAYSIVSLGFLCSGVILQNKNKLEGITTAVTLWTSLISGLFIGLGNYQLAVISAIAIYIILKLKYFKIKFIGKYNVKRKRHN